MFYTVTFDHCGLLSETARARTVALYRAALEEKLGGPEHVANGFAAYLRVSASPIEDATQEDLQACARFVLAYFEATDETLRKLYVSSLKARFEVGLA